MHTRPHARRARRGNVLIVSIMMGTLLGFSALSIDIGMVRVADVQLQAAVDASALGAAGYFDGTTAGIATAESKAVMLGGLNEVFGQPLSVSASDVTIGVYDETATPSFEAWSAAIHEPEEANAVRVEHTPPTFSSALGAIAFGITGYTRTAEAIGVRKQRFGPAGASACFLPLAVPDCYVPTGAPPVNPPPMEMTFNPTPSDNVAWGNPAANPNTAWIRSQLQGQCSGGEIAVGDPMYVNEGQHNSALHEVRDILNNTTAVSPDSWPVPMLGAVPLRDGVQANLPGDSAVLPANYGNVIQGPVALVDAGSCGAPSFTGSVPITGITWAYIYDVESTGGDKNLWLQLDFVNEYEVVGPVDDSATGPNVLGQSDPMLVNPD